MHRQSALGIPTIHSNEVAYKKAKWYVPVLSVFRMYEERSSAFSENGNVYKTSEVKRLN